MPRLGQGMTKRKKGLLNRVFVFLFVVSFPEKNKQGTVCGKWAFNPVNTKRSV
jgi:hypothetical protein